MRGLANFFILTLLVLVLATGLMAQTPPNSIVYQGRLADTSGTAITTTVDVTFAIYSAPSGGTSWWDSTYSVTPDANGVFTQEVGPIPTSVFTGIKLYLGLKVGSDPEMTPRQVLTSAPYSFQSLTLAPNSVTTLTIENGAVSGLKLATGAVSELKLAGNAVTSSKIKDATISTADIAQNGAKTNQILKWNGSRWAVANDALGTGDITSVLPGSGLTGGGSSGAVTLSVPTSGIINSHLSSTAVTGAKVVNGSLSSVDIANEAGIARNHSSAQVTISTSGVTSVISTSITVPGAGYIVVRGFAIGEVFSGGGSTVGSIMAGIATSASDPPPPGEYIVFGSNNENIGTSKYNWGSVAVEKTFGVSASGTHKYYFNAKRLSTDGVAKLAYPKIIATYYPTAYGTVNKIVTLDESTEFDSAIPVDIGPGPANPNSTSTVMYEVDLRELEIKALKAQLEAEKAQQKLDDAKALKEAESNKEKQ